MIGVVVLLGVVAGVGIALVITNGDGDETASSGGPSATSTTRPTDRTTTTVAQATSTTTAPSTPTTPPPWAGQLNSTFAKIRTAPSLDAGEITTVEDRRYDPMTVISGPDPNGWYEIDLDGTRGWLFGAFVLPTAPGQHAAETRDGSRAVLRSSDGTPLPIENPSGDAVLVTGTTSGSYWTVLLPDGSTATVAASEMRIVR